MFKLSAISSFETDTVLALGAWQTILNTMYIYIYIYTYTHYR